MKRLLWIVGLPVVAAAIVYYVRVDVSAAPTQLTFDSVSRGDVVATVEATGTLQPLDTVEVGTQVSGTIASLGTDFNQLVKRGQVLATLDPALFQTQIDQAKATVMRLQCRPRQSAGPIRRRAAQVETRRAARRRPAPGAAGRRYRAIDGSRGRDVADKRPRAVDPGQRGADAGAGEPVAHRHPVADRRHRAEPQRGGGSDRFGRSASPDVVRYRARSHPARVAGSRRRGGCRRRVDRCPVTFTVDAYPRREFNGTVRLVRLQPKTVQNVVTYTTIIDVPNDDGVLKPGMTSTVSIVMARADAVLRVPSAALRFVPTDELLKEFGCRQCAEEPQAQGQATADERS